MDFEAAADLVAALKPFMHPTRRSHLEGLERVARTASRVTGELTEVKRIMPSRPFRRRRDLTEAVSAPGRPEGEGAVSSDEDAAVETTAIQAESSDHDSLSRPSTGPLGAGALGRSPVFILLLVLILLLEAR